MQYTSYTQGFVTYKNGEKGDPGAPGTSTYLHIKYSDDGETFTGNDGNDMGAWIGTLVDHNEEASTTFSDYTWKKFTEDVDEELTQLTQRVSKAEADIEVNSKAIALKASQEDLETVQTVATDAQTAAGEAKNTAESAASTVSGMSQRLAKAETNIGLNTQAIELKASKEEVAKKVDSESFETYQSEVESQFTQTAESIDMKFSAVSEQTKEVDDDLQAWKTQYSKHISFSSDTAITITSTDGTNSITLEIDNEKGIVFKKDGVQFGWWDGNDFHTGNIVVETNERAQFGNFAYVPRSDGSLAFLKVGG